MTIQVYIESASPNRFYIYGALTHAILDTRPFSTRWQAESAARQHGWWVIE